MASGHTLVAHPRYLESDLRQWHWQCQDAVEDYVQTFLPCRDSNMNSAVELRSDLFLLHPTAQLHTETGPGETAWTMHY